MKKQVKPISFRVYPERSFLYCEVNIWPTRKAMHAYLPLGPKTVASCGGRESYVVQPERKGKKQTMRKTGLFAEANFYQTEIGVEVVSHEFTHAAFAFADRRRLPLHQVMDKQFTHSGRKNTLDLDGPEERFCYALGQMCRQFTQKCYDLGLYNKVVQSAASE
jgi:hypothetical protein